MKNMFFVREVAENSDRIFLKPMTLKEYLLYVNNEMKKKVALSVNYVENWRDVFDDERIIQCVNKMMTFEYYPVPCENYKSTGNVWIKTKTCQNIRYNAEGHLTLFCFIK